MQTRAPFRLLALCAIVGSTLGSREPAALAAPAVDYLAPPGPELVHPRAEYRAPDETIAVELAAQWARDAAATEAAARETARLAAELDALWAQWILDVDAAIQARTGRYLPWPTVALIIDAATARGVDPVLVGRIGACESGGRADAYNASGAAGFGQHLISYWPSRAAAAGHPGASPFDLAVNVDVTAWYLSVAGTSPWNPSRHCWG
jgi:hypothetical protein